MNKVLEFPVDIIERFLSYTRINTTTSREKGAAGIMPSSDGQMVLAQLLAKELTALGMEDVVLRDTAILTATLPANIETSEESKPIPTVSFFAHLDTSAEQSNDTKAHIVNYQGGDICLNSGSNVFLKEAEFPELVGYIGDDIIVTDGTSLLGADDKAAIAAIMNALQVLKANPDIPHGTVKVAFVPDEEQGLRGAKAFDVESFGADFGITMKAVSMHGGYDGAVLSQKGLPCPNIFTGAHNFHSIYEYLPVNSLKAASNVVIEVIKITAEGHK